MDDFLLLAEFIIQEYPDIVNFEAKMKYLPSNGMVSTYDEAPSGILIKCASLNALLCEGSMIPRNERKRL